MSGRIVGEVLRNRARIGMTDAEFAVMVSLAESAQDGNRIADRNTHYLILAERAARGAGTIRNVLSTLRRRGLITIEKPAGRDSCTWYRVPELDDFPTPDRVTPGNDTKACGKPALKLVDNPQTDGALHLLRVIPGNALRVTPGNDTAP